MKRSFLALTLSLMLMASLTACSNTPADDKQDDGATATRTRVETVDPDGRYYATGDGQVTGWNDGTRGTNLSDDARRIVDDAVDGVKDLGRDTREMAYDLTHE